MIVFLKRLSLRSSAASTEYTFHQIFQHIGYNVERRASGKRLKCDFVFVSCFYTRTHAAYAHMLHAFSRTHTHTHTHTHTYAHTHARTHENTRARTHTHTRTHTPMHTNAYTNTHTHTCFQWCAFSILGLLIGNIEMTICTPQLTVLHHNVTAAQHSELLLLLSLLYNSLFIGNTDNK